MDQCIQLLVSLFHYTVKTDLTEQYLPVSLVLFLPFFLLNKRKKSSKTQTKAIPNNQINEEPNTHLQMRSHLYFQILYQKGNDVTFTPLSVEVHICSKAPLFQSMIYDCYVTVVCFYGLCGFLFLISKTASKVAFLQCLLVDH